jgi:8-oxo-dGTP pyrophosphatase MutT (NUDIX family)
MTKTDALLPFEEVAKGPLMTRKIFALRQDTVRSQHTGRETQVDRLFCPDWVNVVCFTNDDELVLVRQWRFGTAEFSVEIPAGAVEVGEDPVVAGLRELREETGYTPDDPDAVVLLGATRPNAAFMHNRCFTVFVPRATKREAQDLDPTEEIEVLTFPRPQLDDLMRQGVARCAATKGHDDTRPATDALFDNSLVLVALHLWKLHEQR